MINSYGNSIVLPIINSKHSCITFYINGGSDKEVYEKTGIAHLLEHTLSSQADFGTTFEAETQLEYVLFQSTQAPSDTLKNLKKLEKLLFETPIHKQSFFNSETTP